VTEKIK